MATWTCQDAGGFTTISGPGIGFVLNGTAPGLAQVLCEKLNAIEEVAARGFYLAEDGARYMRLGYDAGFSVELRAIHDALPRHLHRADCDGCAAEGYEPPSADADLQPKASQ